MKRRYGLGVLAALLLVLAAVSQPMAWASANNRANYQTVPSPTPKRSITPTLLPRETPTAMATTPTTPASSPPTRTPDSSQSGSTITPEPSVEMSSTSTLVFVDTTVATTPELSPASTAPRILSTESSPTSTPAGTPPTATIPLATGIATPLPASAALPVTVTSEAQANASATESTPFVLLCGLALLLFLIGIFLLRRSRKSEQ